MKLTDTELLSRRLAGLRRAANLYRGPVVLRLLDAARAAGQNVRLAKGLK